MRMFWLYTTHFMRVLQQAPAHFMRVCIFALLMARPVLPYDLDPGAMLNLCEMFKK